jgi:DNA end-binding protein Ku
MEALRRSVGQESAAAAKSPRRARKAARGEKEMLMPMEGKKKSPARKSAHRQHRKSA